MNQEDLEFARQSKLIVGKRPRWLATVALFAIFVALATIGWDFWDNRNEAQINKVLSKSRELVRLAAIEGESLENVAAWLRALVISGESYRAVEATRTILNADYRARLMAGVVEALAKAGKADEVQQAAGEAIKTAR